MELKSLIKSVIRESDILERFDKYDVELIATNITNEIEKRFVLESR